MSIVWLAVGMVTLIWLWALLGSGVICSAKDSDEVYLWLEAEDFDSYGDWGFASDSAAFGGRHLMGRTSRGTQAPEDAFIFLEIPRDGSYTLWVRSRDFAAQQGARYFKVALGDRELPTLFGTHGVDGWGWQKGGPVDLKKGPLKMRLIDASQYYARVDALILTTDREFSPPVSEDAMPGFVKKVKGNSFAERAFDEAMPAILKGPVELDAYQVASSSVVQNDRLRLEFREVQGDGRRFVVRDVSLLVNDRWVDCGMGPLAEAFLILQSPAGNLAQNVSSQFPVWNQDVEMNIDAIVVREKRSTANVYYAGEPLWAVAESYEVVDARTVRTVSEGANFRLVADWHLPEGTGDPVVEFHFTPKAKGYYSVGFAGFPEWDVEGIDFLLLPYMWLSKRLPSESYLNLETYCPTPIAMVNRKTEEGIPICYGLVVDPGEIPNRWARHNNSRFGLAIRGPMGGARPAFFAPVLGFEDSAFESGDTYSFTFHYLVREGGWFEGYRYAVEEIFELADYRKNGEGSLTDAVLNMTDLMMNDEAGGWDSEAKGPYNIEMKDTVTQAAPLIPLEMYLLTGDEELYRRRALPTMEFLLSRSGAHFTLGETPSTLGGPVELYGTTVYGGFFKATRGLTQAFHEVAVGGGVRANQGYNSIPYWHEELWAYLLTGNQGYLESTKKHADQYLEEEIFGPKRKDLGEQPFINIHFTPYWPALIDLYEATGDRKYLEAAEEGARWLMTSVWTQPVIPEGTVTTSLDEMLQHARWQVWWKGSEKYHLGYPPKPEELTEEAVPAWVVSRVGLGLEQPCTYRGTHSGNIMMSNWAPDLLRLARYTGNPLYRTYARNAVVGRFTNYPGYYITHFNTLQMKPDYPYTGPDVTNIYYHHIYPQLAFSVDFLVTEAWDRSGGAIEFPYVRQQGYAWFSNRVYGFAPGKFFGDEGVWLWLKRDLVKVDNIQVNFLTARKKGTFYIALMNEDDMPYTVHVSISPEIAGETPGDVEVFLTDGKGAWSKGATRILGSSENLLEIALPAKGIVGVKLVGVNVADPPVAAVDPERVMPNPEGTPVVHSTKLLENVHGAILMVNPSYYDAYVYTTWGEDILNSVTLHYNVGDGWRSEKDSRFPFEFTVRVDNPQARFEFFFETENKRGATRKSSVYMMAPPLVK